MNRPLATGVPQETIRHLDEIRRDPGFRAWQAMWKRRIEASRRLVPLLDGTVDPFAPSGRWSS